ncbi:protein-glutamine gamma-glutamyltransferase [Paenibacillus thermoaerophilus]|uniref:Protein-glutamine gamma-glutamyltransferase n=1 Tax=Paenibacillus thermoaerophilus TaxID=1215385 RepID=A0ABW2V7J3_9BACL|nr:protein-glutamine gamma-glutamyltransferase [Paenibacillus thermoaerophilus]TMV15927.1 protein-glutamine gamma-glutamyltransferase [Paenibacillus thermoaerophilus]
MIRIAGAPADPVQIAEGAGLTPIEQRTLMKLAESRLVYRYASREQLLFELRLRREIVRAARELNASGIRFAVDRYATTNPSVWALTPRKSFQLLPGISPAAGIRDIYANGRMYAFECATAMLVVLYKAVLETIGEANFNRLFANLVLYHWDFDRDLRLITLPTIDFLPGDILYFRNPDVNPRTPEWQGENAVDLGDGTYYGHGLGIRPAWEIIQALNRHRVPFSFTSAYLLNQATRPDFTYLAQFASPVYS